MSLNKIILIGRTGKDPEIRYFDSNSAVANFSLATSERGYKLANGTEVPERTEWHNVVAYRELAIFAEKWIKKGSLLYVEGKIRYRTYVDNTGIRRQVTEILAEKINFFESGSSNRLKIRRPSRLLHPSVIRQKKKARNLRPTFRSNPNQIYFGLTPYY